MSRLEKDLDDFEKFLKLEEYFEDVPEALRDIVKMAYYAGAGSAMASCTKTLDECNELGPGILKHLVIMHDEIDKAWKGIMQ